MGELRPEPIDEVRQDELAVDEVLVVLLDVLGQVAHQRGVDRLQLRERVLAVIEDGLVPLLPFLQLGDCRLLLAGELAVPRARSSWAFWISADWRSISRVCDWRLTITCSRATGSFTSAGTTPGAAPVGETSMR